MIDEFRKKLIIVWLAGLISTDGSVAIHHHKKNVVRYFIYSNELDWLGIIRERLSEIGLRSTIQPRKSSFGTHMLSVCPSENVTKLLVELANREFTNPRKFERILYSYNHKAHRYDWQSCDSLVRELYNNGDSIKELAKRFGVKYDAMKAKLQQMGLVKFRREEHRKKYPIAIVLHKQGKTAAEIAEITEMSVFTVRNWLSGKRKP